MGRTLAAAFVTEKNLAWARPFTSAVFHFGGSVGDVYIDTEARTIGGNVHTALAKSLGEWRYLIEPRDGSFQVRTMPVELINLPAIGSPAKRFTDLWSGLGIEGIEVDVKQNFRQVGTATILSEPLFAGVMRPGEYSLDTAEVDLISISEKYVDKKELSYPIARSELPLAAEKEIGKRANAIVGKVTRVLALEVVGGPSSPLRAAMTTASTTVPVYDDFWDIAPAAGNIWIGQEKIGYGAKGGAAGSRTLITLARQKDGTLLQAHAANDIILFIPPQFIYQVSGRKMKSLTAAYVARGDTLTPLDPSEYTFEAADTTLIPGKTQAVIKINAPTLLEKIRLLKALGTEEYTQIANGDALVLDVAGSKTLDIEFGPQVRPKIGGQYRYKINCLARFGAPSVPNQLFELQLGAGHRKIVLYETDAAGNVRHDFLSNYEFVDDHYHSLTGGQQFRFKYSVPAGTTIGNPGTVITVKEIQVAYDIRADVGAADRKFFEQYADGALLEPGSSSHVFNPGPQERVKTEGKYIYRWEGQQWVIFPDIGCTTRVVRPPDPNILLLKLNATGVKYVNAAAAIWVCDHYHETWTIEILNADGEWRLNNSRASVRYLTSDVQGVKGDSSLTSGVDKIGRITTAQLVVGDQVLFDGEGEPDDASGTYTGTADALIEKPADVLHYLARALGGVPLSRIDTAAFVTARTDSPASYKLSGNLIERSANLKELLLALGQQSRIKVDWPVDKLTARFLKTSYPAISKTLTEDNVMRQGGLRSASTLKIKRSPIEDIINSINLRYGRDWSKSRVEDAFTVKSGSDATSIARYGERKQDERFWCDFVAKDNSTMADDLHAFFLARFKEPARIISFDCKLDQYELLPGDVIGLNFKAQQQTSAAPATLPLTLPFTLGGAGLPGEIFDGLNGSQKLLVEDVALRPGGARDNRPTRMELILREVS